MIRLIAVCFAVLLLVAGDAAPAGVDLLITNATLFDARRGVVMEGVAVSVVNGVIRNVQRSSEISGSGARRVIDAEGKLLIPGLIDTHGHLVDVLATLFSPGGGGIADLDMAPDSIAAYRRIFSAAYLPFGVTVVRDAGSSDDYLPLMKAWMVSDSSAPDFFPCGGALVSHEEGRTPYEGHTVVRDSLEAEERVRQYHDAGFKYIKLYWRLREPEFRVALNTAFELRMIPFAHIDRGIFTIEAALGLGLRHFEHVFTLAPEVLGGDGVQSIIIRSINEILDGDTRGAFFMATAEQFSEIGEENEQVLALIKRFSKKRASMTPTLHAVAKPLGLTVVDTPPIGDFDDTSAWAGEDMERARRGYAVMASYVALMHKEGVRLAIGSDTVDPGMAVLSEMLLLHEAGIPINEVLKIATYGSARVMELTGLYGSIEPGKRAHFVIFDENPLENPEALLGGKTVIKDGVVWEGQSTGVDDD